MDDSRITELLRGRDEKAVRLIAEKYGGLIKKLISGILKEPQDIDEAVNDTYLNIWESSAGKEPSNLIAFVCRVAKNTALKKVRYNNASKRASVQTSVDELAEILPGRESAESELNEKLLTAAINGFLEELPANKRIVFVKRYWYYEPIEDIAKETGMKPGTVATLLFRLRSELKEKLTEEGWLI